VTDLGTQLRASLDAQSLVQDVLSACNDMLRAGNDLFNSPTDVEAFLATLAAVERARRTLGDLDRLVRHPDEH
jgi:hypothetical protein